MQAPPGCEIRAATDADSEAVRQLVDAVTLEFNLGAQRASEAADLESVASAYGRDGGWFEVLLCGDELVGTLGMMPVSPGVLELRKMYFRPQVRGLGLGKAVLARNLSRARAAGFDAVVLETATALEAARALYAKFGFRRESAGAGSCSSGCDQRWRLQLSDYEPPAMTLVELREADPA